MPVISKENFECSFVIKFSVCLCTQVLLPLPANLKFVKKGIGEISDVFVPSVWGAGSGGTGMSVPHVQGLGTPWGDAVLTWAGSQLLTPGDKWPLSRATAAPAAPSTCSFYSVNTNNSKSCLHPALLCFVSNKRIFAKTGKKTLHWSGLVLLK